MLKRDPQGRIRLWGYCLHSTRSSERSAAGGGIKVFDGKGNFTQRDYIGDSVPAEFAPPGQERGTYTVNPDCTGSMVINLNAPVPSGSTGLIKILLVISNGGRHVHEVVSEFTPPGSTEPQPTQTSADDWKVASEQDH